MSPETEVLRRRPSDWHVSSFTPIFHDHAVKVATASALRTRSFAYRHYLAGLASRGELDYEQVHEGVEPEQWDPRWLVGLARTLAFQELEPEDRPVGLRLLERAVELLPEGEAEAHLEEIVQLLISQGRWKDAWDRVEASLTLQEREGGYLRTDLLNPFSGSPYGDPESWQEHFGSIFAAGGHAAPRVEDGPGHAFDRLRCSTPAPLVEDGPLVSVVMTTFQAETVELATSVRSILEQTYRNLEVLLIDDCSPEEFVPGLEEIAALDPRIRLVRLEKNGGTYLARNAGMRLARGELVTGQDADDWSHPERIAHQVLPLLEDEGLAGTRCRGLTTNEHLLATRPGYSATRPNPSSLMFRRELGLQLGGFLHARKGADSEFHARLDVVSERPVRDLDAAPLTVVRIRSDSLSRSDFRPGWTHSSRRTFIDAYRHWHKGSPVAEVARDHSQDSPVSIPWAFQIERPAPRHFDLVWVGDFRPRTLRSAARADEVRALVDSGLEVAVLQLEDLRYQTARKDAFEPELLSLINAGRLSRISEDEAHSADLVVVRHTAPLASPPALPLALQAERLAIVADRLAWDPEDGIEALEHEAAVARALFGLAPVWVAPTAAAREALARALPDAEIAEELLPETVDPRGWLGARPAPRPGMPVLGRAGPDFALTWPADLEAVHAAFPVDGQADVRVLGSRRALRSVEGAKEATRSWLTFSHEEIDSRTFLASVDFLVHEPSAQVAALTDLPVVEALASGCVVVLPPELAAGFGDAVVAAEPGTAARTVQRLYRDRAGFARRSRRAVEHVRREHGVSRATQLVRSLLG